MSMLSEPRRRAKYGLNPRGKYLQNDGDNFGRKMMEKMGWANGKGLGKGEQGNVDIIRVQMKNDNKGIGFTGVNDKYTQHYDAFEDALSSLQSLNENSTDGNDNVVNNPPKDKEPEESLASLEAKSKMSRARVHYHKFTRGKDTSRFSEHDMACILGAKKSKRHLKKDESNESSKNNSDDEQQNTTSNAEEENKEVKSSHGFVTISGGNISDYFKAKMSAFLNQKTMSSTLANSVSQYVSNDTVTEEHECTTNKKQEKEHNLGNEYKENYDSVEIYHKLKKKHKKKRKHRDTEIREETNNTDDSSHSKINTLKSETSEIENPEKAQKGKKMDEVICLDSTVELETSCDSEIEEIPIKSKKKKKTKNRDNEDSKKEASSVSELTSESNCNEDGVSEKSKKSKKRKREYITSELETNSNDDSNNLCKSKKSKKKKVSFADSTVEYDFVSSNNDEKENLNKEVDIIDVKKKKKKKKDKLQDKENCDAASCEGVEYLDAKKSKNVDDITNLIEVIESVPQKKHKSKKKKSAKEECINEL